MAHHNRRTLVVVLDVPEQHGLDVAQNLKRSLDAFPGAVFRKAYWDDAPRNAPVDALKAPGSDGSPPEDQSSYLGS